MKNREDKKEQTILTLKEAVKVGDIILEKEQKLKIIDKPNINKEK